MSKRQKRKTKKTKQPYGYQPNNPLTIYYKKYIEKSTSESKKYPRKKLRKSS